MFTESYIPENIEFYRDHYLIDYTMYKHICRSNYPIKGFFKSFELLRCTVSENCGAWCTVKIAVYGAWCAVIACSKFAVHGVWWRPKKCGVPSSGKKAPSTAINAFTCMQRAVLLQDKKPY